MKRTKSRLSMIITFVVIILSFLSISSVYLVIGDMNKRKIVSDTTNSILLCDSIRIDSIKVSGSIPYLNIIDSLRNQILIRDSISSRKDSTIYNQKKLIDTFRTKYYIIRERYSNLKYNSK